MRRAATGGHRGSPAGHDPQAIWDARARSVALAPIAFGCRHPFAAFGFQEHNQGREVTRLSERAAVWPARAVWAVTAVLVVANAALIVVAFPDLHPGDRFYNSLLDVGGSCSRRSGS
jgi:hypothetical protein